MNPQSERRERAVDLVWLLGWLALSSWWILSAAATIGATFDEPNEIQRALDFWRRGSHHELMRVGSMPLPMDVAALPAFIYEQAMGVEIDLNRDCPMELLYWCRAIMLVFWAMLLWYAGVVGRCLGGPWAGRLAIAFLACEPNFLAHACLATKDICIAAFLLPALYSFSRGRQAGVFRRVIVPGIWFAGCLLAKASAMVFAPLGMFVIEAQRLVASGAFAPDANPGSWRRRWIAPLRPFIHDMLGVGILGVALTFVYCGSDWKTEPSWIAWAHQLPEGTFKTCMVYLSEHLAIFNNAGVGLVKQIGHNLRGHGAFLLGVSSPRSMWYYFPVAIAIKMTLPILLLPVVLAALSRRSLLNWACLVAGLLFLYSVQCRVQIGIRLMLPWIAVGIVGLSAAAARGIEEARGHWRCPALASICGLGLLWNVHAALAVWPHGLCYVNEFWGGSTEGYRIISDSNYDWGQGIPELRRWLLAHGKPPTNVWYFGTDPSVDQLPAVHRSYQPNDEKAFLDDVKGKYLAVGTTAVYGAYVPPDTAVNRILHRMQPAARTQTFLIYDFTDEAVARR